MLTAQAILDNRDPRPAKELLKGLVNYGDTPEAEGFASDCYYQAYFAVAKLVQPRSVLEIGVKRGWSLVAMLRGWPEIASIVGIDNECYVPKSQALALENLRAAGYTGAIDLPIGLSVGYSKKLSGHPPFDLIHVDGGHSYLEAFSDILEYWPLLRAGGVMVVDDVGHAPEVAKAVQDATPQLSGATNSFFFPNPHTGWQVLIK